MKILATLNFEHCTPEEIEKLPLRRSARAVMFDKVGRVALLHVTKDDYHKLPGGGIDPGETIMEGLHRECLEETGCRIEVVRELGLVIEYRKTGNINQESYVYLARVMGEKVAPTLTEAEKKAGFILEWISFAEALVKAGQEVIPDVTKGFIVTRDRLLLQETQRCLRQDPSLESLLLPRGMG